MGALCGSKKHPHECQDWRFARRTSHCSKMMLITLAVSGFIVVADGWDKNHLCAGILVDLFNNVYHFMQQEPK